ncbi:UDP-N-acetylglucosamine 1-carboxyvinyltransferase [Rubrobacter taiwanensis]|uniref:UDP-N-acetylglucosamine 1-carboxyvinyltransferase n=1 Tax=Rubrobacter taiwanensis TaxID=185139 RepID=A0A4R1BQF8_9ACTN|nr:UDP-N-acetylglucosamine 1-carboxyvinyltransferase [Rubrobacter taiwanensis]TCJ19425.1 UDP-N-acetylglucosamine 1-carboxyvinyltransferase [Rubrobacter taiwanensis]
MSRFIVEGGNRLRGEVRVSGAKNAALKLVAAALLTSGRTVLHNVPDIKDIGTMRAVIEEMGARTEHDSGTLTVEAEGVDSFVAPYELVRQMRASILVLGPLVARFGQAEVSAPGGCDLGFRKFDFHMNGLRALGAEVELDHGFIKARAPRGLRGADIYFDYPSVTATENVMMAAVLARGRTVIENAAREPEVVEFANFLNRMGARIRNAGSSRVEIEGVEELHPVEHTVMPDRIEAGTFIMAAAATGGDVRVVGAVPRHLGLTLDKLRAMGVELEEFAGGIRVRVDDPRELAAVDVSTLPFPGYATDLQPQMMVLLTQVSGAGVITENVFENRLRVAEELNRMGAGIDVFGGHRAIVRGPKRLSGTIVQAPDLRGGAALVMAGLAAEGVTTVDRATHILRGYERFEAKLSGLGAAISYESSAALV